MLNIEKLYDEYFDEIFNYLLKRVIRVEVAEDLTSTVFMKVLKNAKKYNPKKGSEKTWLYSIAQNTLYDFFRKKKETIGTEKYQHKMVGKDIETEIIEKQKEFEEEMAKEKLFEIINDKCNFEEKDLLISFYIEGKSYDELSNLTGVKAVTLRSKVHRIVKKIKKYVKNSEEVFNERY